MSADEERIDALLVDLDLAEVIDVIPDATGDKVRVGRLRDAVLIGVQGSPGILDTPERRDRFALAWTEACLRADGGIPASLTFGDAFCDCTVSEEEDPEEGPRACGKPSRFIVARSDGDTSYGVNGGTAEACEQHLAEVVAGMVEGDPAIRAVVTIRWDPPEAS